MKGNTLLLAGTCLLVLSLPCSAQTVVASARVMCGVGQPWETSGPIVGAIINQTTTTITDLEVELSIITRDIRFAFYTVGGTGNPEGWPAGLRWLFEHLPFLGVQTEKVSMQSASPMAKAIDRKSVV